MLVFILCSLLGMHMPLVQTKVLWWEHSSKSGQYSSAKVHKTLSVNPDGSFELGKLDGLEAEIIDGF